MLPPIALAIVLCCPWPLDPRAVADVDAHFTASETALTRYRHTHSMTDLEKASDALDGTLNLDALSIANFTESRRRFVVAWSTVLARVEIARQSAIKNAPVWIDPCPLPPPGDAYDILFPTFCTRFYHARNDEEWERVWPAYYARVASFYKQQAPLRNLQQMDALVLSGLQLSLRMFCSLSPPDMKDDFQALDAIVTGAGIDDTTRIEIISNFCMTPGPRE